MDIIEIFEPFPDQEACLELLEQLRWQGKPKCPYCRSESQTPLKKERRYHCNSCNASYSVTVSTIFHKTHLPIQKWFLALSLILNAKKGISARQLAKHLKVNRNTAWRISTQIRKAMIEPEQRNMLIGLIEMNETFIGGKPRKKHKKQTFTRGRGTKKPAVVGMVEHGGKIKAKLLGNSKQICFKKLSTLVRETVNLKKSVLITDEDQYYKRMRNFLPHVSIYHQVSYVDGWIHTNSIESFWALLKRGIIAQFHKVSVRHLPKYLCEFSYRFNNRHKDDVFTQTLVKGLGVV